MLTVNVFSTTWFSMVGIWLAIFLGLAGLWRLNFKIQHLLLKLGGVVLLVMLTVFFVVIFFTCAGIGYAGCG